MHATTQRSATPEEARRLGRTTRPDPGSWGCLAIMSATWIVMLYELGGWIGGHLDQARLGAWSGVAIATAFASCSALSFYRFERRRRQKAVLDDQRNAIQEISIDCQKVVELVPIGDDAPAFCFDLGQGTLLILQGQWLLDPVIYGGPDAYHCDDEGDAIANGLPEPYSFPRTKFTVARAPHSGDVLGITLAGQYLPPTDTVDALKPEYELGDSVVLSGTLDDLPRTLARHYSVDDA